MTKKILEQVPWGSVLVVGGLGLGGILLYRAAREGFTGLPSLGDVFSGLTGEITGGIAEAAGGAIGGALRGLSPLAIGKTIGEAVGAREWGERGYDVTLAPYQEETAFIAHLQWTGEPPAFKGYSPIEFAKHKLTEALVQPQAALGGATKQVLIEAPWRDDPSIYAELGPWAAEYMEAQRSKYVEAGLI